VKSGDTLGQVAASNKITLATLLAVNPTITNANLIYVGQVVNIPSTTTVTIPCTTTTTPRRGGLNATDDGSSQGFTGAVSITAPAIDNTQSDKTTHSSSAFSTRTSVLPLAAAVTLLGLLSMAFAS